MSLNPSLHGFPLRGTNTLLSSELENSSFLEREGLDDLLGMDLNFRLAREILDTEKTETEKAKTKTTHSPSLGSRFSATSSLDRKFLPINPVEVLGDETEGIKRLSFEEKMSELQHQLGEINTQAKLVIRRIQEFYKGFRSFEKKYDQLRKDLSEFGNFQVNILALLDYYNFNHDNFLTMLAKVLPPDQYEEIADKLDFADSTCKWINCLSPLAFDLVKYCINNQVEAELNDFQLRFNHLRSLTKKPTFDSPQEDLLHHIQKRMELLKEQVKQDQKDAIEKGRKKADKFASKVSALTLQKLLGLAHKQSNKIAKSIFGIFRQISKSFENSQARQIQNKLLFHLQPRILVNKNHPSPFSQEELYREVEKFLASLKRCSNLEEVKKKLSQIGITEHPSSFREWQQLSRSKRFRRHTVQNYYYTIGKRPFMDARHFRAISKKRQSEKQEKIDQSLTFIQHHLKRCQPLDFDQIKEYLKKEHIHLDRLSLQTTALKLPPTTKEEWNLCVENREFCLALADQWVDYQETSGLIAKHVFSQYLLSKHHVEKKMLDFRKITYFVNITSFFTQLVVCLTSKFKLMISILDVFLTDLVKTDFPGIGLICVFHPLYPDLSFKWDNLALSLTEHFFAAPYKPHEYSLEGYKLLFQIHWFEFITIAHYFLSLFQQILLWLNMRLVDNCILGLEKKSLEQDSRFSQITEAYERHRLTCKEHIQELEGELDKLKLEDAKRAFYPSYQKSSSDGKSLDPLQEFIEVLSKTQPEFFAKETLEFFQEHLKVDLRKINKERLKERLEDFFSLSEDEFVLTHHNYLRAFHLRA